MTKIERQGPRKPATKLANVRKKMEKLKHKAKKVKKGKI